MEVGILTDSDETSLSIPKDLAVWAELSAISANCWAFGFGLTAQSPYTMTLSARHMKNTLDTREIPGFVLMISNAGRTVAAVLWTAPETMPSACPL